VGRRVLVVAGGAPQLATHVPAFGLGFGVWGVGGIGVWGLMFGVWV